MNFKKTFIMLAIAFAFENSFVVKAEEVQQGYKIENIKPLEKEIFYGYEDVGVQRKAIVNTALSMQGKIKYIWGDKPTKKGWNEVWEQEGRGLDCSGFIQWVYWTSLDMQYEQGTSNLSSAGKEITYEELKPGDIGIIYEGGSYYMDAVGNRFITKEEAVQSNINSMVVEPEKSVKAVINHCGIYVGKDENGNDLWCHCKGGIEKTVVVDNYDKFTYFRSIIEE